MHWAVQGQNMNISFLSKEVMEQRSYAQSHTSTRVGIEEGNMIDEHHVTFVDEQGANLTQVLRALEAVLEAKREFDMAVQQNSEEYNQPEPGHRDYEGYDYDSTPRDMDDDRYLRPGRYDYPSHDDDDDEPSWQSAWPREQHGTTRNSAWQERLNYTQKKEEFFKKLEEVDMTELAESGSSKEMMRTFFQHLLS